MRSRAVLPNTRPPYQVVALRWSCQVVNDIIDGFTQACGEFPIVFFTSLSVAHLPLSTRLLFPNVGGGGGNVCYYSGPKKMGAVSSGTTPATEKEQRQRGIEEDDEESESDDESEEGEYEEEGKASGSRRLLWGGLFVGVAAVSVAAFVVMGKRR